MFALFALIALVVASSGPRKEAQRGSVWAGGDLSGRPPTTSVDDGTDVDPVPPPSPSVGVLVPESLPWSSVGSRGVVTYQDTMVEQARELALPPNLPDGRYALRVQLHTTSGTPVCFDVVLRFGLRNGLPFDLQPRVNGYPVIDPADVGACERGMNVGPVGTYRIGDYRYAAVNRTGFQGRGPAWAVEVVGRGDAHYLQLRCARDWQQRYQVTLTLARTGDA